MTSKSSSEVIFPLPSLSKSRNAFLKSEMNNTKRVLPAQLCLYFKKMLGGVYMRKLALARVSYRHDFLISYRVYMMTGLFSHLVN